MKQAVEATEEGHPDRASWLTTSAYLLSLRYQHNLQPADLENAVVNYESAWRCQNANPSNAFRRRQSPWKDFRSNAESDLLLRSEKETIDLLPIINTKLLSRDDQQFVMATFAGIAANLCAFLLETNQPTEALLYLEKGRAVIIGQLIDARSDVSFLAEQHPDLARRYKNVRDQLNDQSQKNQLAAQRREVAERLDVCIREIRQLPGHERFLLGQTVAEMQSCAVDGPIVIVNITRLRSDAIIVSAGAIKAINLAQLRASDAEVWLQKKWNGRRSERRQKNMEYLEYLSWLWDVCVKEILDEVEMTKQPAEGLPRVWWIGAGLGHSMPFHAAGRHSASSTENALSKAISSYTPFHQSPAACPTPCASHRCQARLPSYRGNAGHAGAHT